MRGQSWHRAAVVLFGIRRGVQARLRYGGTGCGASETAPRPLRYVRPASERLTKRSPTRRCSLASTPNSTFVLGPLPQEQGKYIGAALDDMQGTQLACDEKEGQIPCGSAVRQQGICCHPHTCVIVFSTFLDPVTSSMAPNKASDGRMDGRRIGRKLVGQEASLL